MAQIEKATLTISMPRTMKDFIRAKLEEGRFSTPSEYIRSLIRDDQDASFGNGREIENMPGMGRDGG